MIEKEHPHLSTSQQCKMLNIARSSYYDYAQGPTAPDEALVDRIGKIYGEKPAYGSRCIKEIICRQGTKINRKKVQRLMREMNIQGICPKPNLSLSSLEHKKYPYIARDEPIVRINQVWSTDITYVTTKFGTVYLVAVIDWHSRLILSWNMSNSMGEEFCIEALEKSLTKGIPYIFNTD
jgi:putative transposase